MKTITKTLQVECEFPAGTSATKIKQDLKRIDNAIEHTYECECDYMTDAYVVNWEIYS